MTGGFWAGAIPPWAYVIGVILCNLFLLTGMWVGYGRGWAHAEEDQRGDEEEGLGIERPAELAPGYMRGYRLSVNGQQVYSWQSDDPEPFSPEVAHEAWLAHTEQAMHLANREPDRLATPAEEARDDPWLADPRTDSEWTADMAASMDAFIGRLLNDHPATEEL